MKQHLHHPFLSDLYEPMGTDMNRQEKKRIARAASEIYLMEHNVGHPGASRKERRAMARQLHKRILREVPAEKFEPRRIVTPVIIRPEIEVQAEGLELGRQEKRSPGGGVILLS